MPTSGVPNVARSDATAFSAEEAAAMGLVNYVVPAADLDAKVDWLLGRIIDKSPTAVRLGKYAFHAIQDLPIEASLAFTESNIRLVSMTDDARDGMRAFVEKRPPRWQNP